MPYQDQVPFIGRDDELELIRLAVTDSGSRRVICFVADGGVGKTRLLRELHQRYVEGGQATLAITEILDFDDRQIHSPRAIERAIATSLDPTQFEQYDLALRDWGMMERAGVGSDLLAEAEQRVGRRFVTCFNAIATERRVLVFFDTTEQLTPDSWVYLSHLISQLKNCLFLFAGREGWPSDAEVVPLRPFTTSESEQYLNQKQELLLIRVEPEIAERLLILAAGRPILIDLAVELRSRGNLPAWLIAGDLTDITSNAFTSRLAEFERQLVLHIVQNRNDLDHLTLVLALIYPLSASMVARLLSCTLTDAESLVAEATRRPYIKPRAEGSIALHDEMRRIVNDHVWPEVDPDGDQQRGYRASAVLMFKDEVIALEQRIVTLGRTVGDPVARFLNITQARQQMESFAIQMIEHSVIADLDDGFTLFEELTQKARDNLRLRFAEQLYTIIEANVSRLSQDQRDRLTLIRARLFNDRNRPDEAEQLLSELLNSSRGDSFRHALIYNALAVSAVKQGKIPQAYDYQLRCYTIYKEADQQAAIPGFANYLGYICRLRGDWEASVRYYRIALDAAIRAGDASRSRIADILNNLGFVLKLEGRYVEGRSYCEQAIKIWISLASPKQISRGEITLANILRDQGQYDAAIRKINQAIVRLEMPDDVNQLVNAYLTLGWILWYQGVAENSRAILVDSISAFERSRAWAREYHVITWLPAILNQSSNVYWLLDRKEEARASLFEAYDLACKISDIRYAVDSLVGKAEFDVEEGVYDHIPGYAEQLKRDYEDQGYSYPIFFGRMQRILADIAFTNGRYEEARPLYAAGLGMIKRHGGYAMYSIDHELGALEGRIATLSSDNARAWYEFLKESWSKLEPAEFFSSLIGWCDQRLVDLSLNLLG